MNFMLDAPLISPEDKINYRHRVMLVGSCFTEHMAANLEELKFQVLQNPHGILFDPASVAGSIVSYIQDKRYRKEDLIYLNELWQSWDHHSVFSHVNEETCLETINESQTRAHQFLKKTNWLLITLGTSFSYRLKENNHRVANCHRASAQWFNKHLMTIEEINSVLDNCIHQLFAFNPGIRLVFSVSPVRHIRDGVIDNNRSKARLIECVHHLVNKFNRIYYFPAYELVIDVLRDYRFYDVDMVHPNYQATSFVMEKFIRNFMDEESALLMEEIKKIIIARKHKAFQPSTKTHRQFLENQLDKTRQLQSRYSFLDLDEELAYFSNQSS